VDVELTVTNIPLIANPGGQYTGVEGEAIVLDGSNSVGNIVLYEWDTDNDNIYEYSSPSPTQSHIFTEAGSYYIIRLRVTDDLDSTAEALTLAYILDALPTADFTGSPTSGMAPLTVNFTSNSTGFDQPLTYEWDFDNDGTVDSSEENPSYIYSNSGTYAVNLTVTDSDGSSDSLTRTNYITVCYPPARITGVAPVHYSSMQAAYDDAEDGGTIQSQAQVFVEDLTINRNISLTLEGGYDCDYSTHIGITTLHGDMTISNGIVTLENFILE
jgi:PKD repeat protein